MAAVSKGLFGLSQFYSGVWHGPKHLVDVLNRIIDSKNGVSRDRADKLARYTSDKKMFEADIAAGKFKDNPPYLRMVKANILTIDNAINRLNNGNKKQGTDGRNMAVVNELITASKKVLEIMDRLKKEDASWEKNSAPRIKTKKQ